jgi:sulfite reductase (NADPH) hemoprotein beta-component
MSSPSTAPADAVVSLFGRRAVLCDASPPESSLEHAYGAALAHLQRRARLADKAAALLSAPGKKLAPQTRTGLQDWLAARSETDACATSLAFLDQWLARDGAFDKEVQALYDARAGLAKPSLWVVAADGWGRGSDVAGLHHILSSGEDINVLVLASDPATDAAAAAALAAAASSSSAAAPPAALPPPRRDLGLYALNYGGVYVASTAPSSKPEQFQAALREADAFRGPSLVLVYLPPTPAAEGGGGGDDDALTTGRWPLYRYDPAKDAAGAPGGGFTLDSDKLRADLAAFVDRANELALLSSAEPTLPAVLTASADADAEARRAGAEAAAKASFDKLMGALTLPPLLILYGSDGGNAENAARRLGAEAKAKGFTSIAVKAMDSVPVETLTNAAATPLAVFVVSTAGQGEFPSNARGMWKSLPPAPDANANADASAAGPFLAGLHFAVFGLGDSNYWPRKEQRIFFNKASVDLDARLGALGGKRLVERGVGDDQDVGGFSAGFRRWIPELWAALGVGSPADASVENPRVRGNEDIKKTSNFLRGTIAQGLVDTSTGALTYEDTQLTKFHGIYQQDDRDIRGDRKRKGLEPAFSFMVRVRIPGGVCTPAQYLALDSVADTHANGTIRATTRQAVQFHGIIKGLLKPSIAAINRTLMDTLAACGDVNRNVMCTVNPESGLLYADTVDFSCRLSAYLSPRTSAYHEIWLDEKLVAGGADDYEPIYGKEYLPRKFKIGVAVPPDNDVDVYTQDLSYVAVADPVTGRLAGFNVLVGGGMGMTHNNVKTFPRLAEVLGYVPLDRAISVGEAVVTTQRDYGDRTNRKHARLKYTIDDRGIDWFRSEVERRVGFALEPARPFAFRNNADRLGWTRNAADGAWSYTFFVQNGRIKDTGAYRLKSGLKAIASSLRGGEFRFTANQNVMVAGVSDGADKAQLAALLAEYGVENTNMSGLRLNSMACVALPTCALALAESERYLPSLIDKLDVAVDEAGLHDAAITIRMTGCPNGCARPFVAEIGFVGRSPGIYNVYLGAGHSGERLNKLFREGLDEEQIVAELSPLIRRYAKERNEGEPFGDYVIRAGVVKATVSGRTFHDL